MYFKGQIAFVSVIFIVVIALFAGTYVFHNQTQNEKIEILIFVDTLNEKIDVTYKFPIFVEDSLVFQFPVRVPGSYWLIEKSVKENFEALDYENNPLHYKTADSILFIIKPSNNIKEIRYSILKSEINEGNVLSDGIIIDKDIIVINMGVAAGYIEKYYSLPINVICTNIHNKKCISVNNRQINDSTFNFTFKDYNQLIDNSLVFSSIADSTSFQVGKNRISVFTHSPNHKVTSEDMAIIVKPVVEAIWEEIDFLPLNDYKLVFVFNHLIIYNMFNFSAIEHPKFSFYHFFNEPNFDDNIDSLFFVFFVKLIVAHEIFHLFTPLSFSDTFLNPYNPGFGSMSKHLWLYEGFVEYYSAHLIYNRGIITKEEYFYFLSLKLLPFTWGNTNFSLTNVSKNIFDEPDFVTKFYSRGAILSLLLDIEIIDKTNGQKNLFDVLKEIYSQNPIFEEDYLFSKIAELSDSSIYEFIENYIIGESVPIFDNYLQKAGLTIEVKEKIIWYTFAIAGFEIDYENNRLKFSSKNLKDNSIDTYNLTSINDLPVNIYTFGFMFNRLITPRQIKITYLENNLEKAKFIEQQERLYPDYKDITIKDSLTEQEKNLFFKLFRQ